MALDHVRIQNKLVDLGRAGPYYRVAYAADGKLSVVLDMGDPAEVDPVEVLANQITQGGFSNTNVRNRRALVEDRTDWTWQLHLGFNEDVILEAFERQWQTPILLPADKTAGERLIRLHLGPSTYVHPPQQGAKSLKVTYLVTARYSPL